MLSSIALAALLQSDLISTPFPSVAFDKGDRSSLAMDHLPFSCLLAPSLLYALYYFRPLLLPSRHCTTDFFSVSGWIISYRTSTCCDGAADSATVSYTSNSRS